MTVTTPLWLQKEDYSAREDRQLLSFLLRGQERVFEGLAVTQDGVGNFNVVVNIGKAAIVGDDITEQGMYLVEVTAAETIPVPASPGTGTRTDLVVLRVNDSQAGGAGTPAEVGKLEVIEGVDAGSPPDTAVPLFEIARTDNESAILDGALTDVRPLGQFPYTVSTALPPASYGIEGDLWVTVS